jgi:hypothetical protein
MLRNRSGQSVRNAAYWGQGATIMVGDAEFRGDKTRALLCCPILALAEWAQFRQFKTTPELGASC